MKALQIDRKLAKFAAARIAGAINPGSGAAYGPLELVDTPAPELPGPEWSVIKPRLAGICGSDLSTIDGVRIAILRTHRELPVRARPRSRC